jgi:hypothetical protein
MSGTARPPAGPGRKRLRGAPPKTRPGAYAPRPGAGPGRALRRTQCHDDSRRPVRLVLPAEPPVLNPAAARALLRILLKAHAAQEGANQMTDARTGDGSRKGEES